MIILDEAYFEFAKNIPEYPDSMHYRYNNVITLRSFSKAYGLGGLRIGYGFAHHDLISNLMKVKVPFEPSIPAQIAGCAALEDLDFLDKTIKANKNSLQYLQNEFNKLGVLFLPTAANFITTIWKSEDEAKSIVNKLMESGIIVRHLKSFGWPNYIRISTGLEKENKRLISQLKAIL